MNKKKVKYVYGYPVPKGKFRISLNELLSQGHTWSTPIDVDGLDDLIEKLKSENVYQVTFKYNCHFWEGVNFHEGPVKIEAVTQELFDWVKEKTMGNHRFIRIHKRKLTNAQL